MKQRKREKQTTVLDTTTETHQQIIDKWFTNGFNGTMAVQAIRPELTDNVAAVTFNSIKNNPKNQAYIDEKRSRLKANTDVRNEDILKELLNFAYSDITTMAGMTMEELRELPPEIRRCIASMKRTEHYDKAGNYTGETIEIKLVDKLKAIENISKHIGFYSEDNRQKGNNINILQVLRDTEPQALNSILIAMEKSKQ